MCQNGSASSEQPFVEGREDAEELARLLAEVQPALLRLGARRGLGREDCEDALQETLMRFHQAQGRVANPVAWLHTVMHRECLRLLGRRQFEREETAARVLEMHARVDSGFAQRLHRVDLGRLLGRLRARERRLLLLFYFAGVEAREVARRIGCRTSSLKRLLARARASARESLRETGSVRSPTEE